MITPRRAPETSPHTGMLEGEDAPPDGTGK
jgi:hypothetical protein